MLCPLHRHRTTVAAVTGRAVDRKLELPAIARAVACLSLYDRLDLTLELLDQRDWPELEETEPLPTNVLRFRPRTRWRE